MDLKYIYLIYLNWAGSLSMFIVREVLLFYFWQIHGVCWSLGRYYHFGFLWQIPGVCCDWGRGPEAGWNRCYLLSGEECDWSTHRLELCPLSLELHHERVWHLIILGIKLNYSGCQCIVSGTFNLSMNQNMLIMLGMILNGYYQLLTSCIFYLLHYRYTVKNSDGFYWINCILRNCKKIISWLTFLKCIQLLNYIAILL